MAPAPSHLYLQRTSEYEKNNCYETSQDSHLGPRHGARQIRSPMRRIAYAVRKRIPVKIYDVAVLAEAMIGPIWAMKYGRNHNLSNQLNGGIGWRGRPDQWRKRQFGAHSLADASRATDDHRREPHFDNHDQ